MGRLLGIEGGFLCRADFWVSIIKCKEKKGWQPPQTESTPAHAQVTQTVSRTLCAKKLAAIELILLFDVIEEGISWMHYK